MIILILCFALFSFSCDFNFSGEDSSGNKTENTTAMETPSATDSIINISGTRYMVYKHTVSAMVDQSFMGQYVNLVIIAVPYTTAIFKIEDLCFARNRPAVDRANCTSATSDTTIAYNMSIINNINTTSEDMLYLIEDFSIANMMPLKGGYADLMPQTTSTDITLYFYFLIRALLGGYYYDIDGYPVNGELTYVVSADTKVVTETRVESQKYYIYKDVDIKMNENITDVVLMKPDIVDDYQIDGHTLKLSLNYNYKYHGPLVRIKTAKQERIIQIKDVE
jgi:hypothetical protein